MIHLPLKQGSPEWQAARLGIPTGSGFDKIISPKTRKPSASADKYMCWLVAERLFPEIGQGDVTDFMVRGKELEQQAVSNYEFVREIETTVCGMCLDDSRRWAVSPDRLVGDDITGGLLEVKCLSAGEHIRALLFPEDMAAERAPQCQGQMLVTGRAWCDLMFYNPMLPAKVVRMRRDEDYCTDLRAALVAFCNRLDAAERKLRLEYGLGAGTVAAAEATTEAKAGLPAPTH